MEGAEGGIGTEKAEEKEEGGREEELTDVGSGEAAVEPDPPPLRNEARTGGRAVCPKRCSATEIGRGPAEEETGRGEVEDGKTLAEEEGAAAVAEAIGGDSGVDDKEAEDELGKEEETLHRESGLGAAAEEEAGRKVEAEKVANAEDGRGSDEEREETCAKLEEQEREVVEVDVDPIKVESRAAVVEKADIEVNDGEEDEKDEDDEEAVAVLGRLAG